ncbi:hypothetical protein HPB47_008121 [Ixodes persulcatus]|uniref:Uncharacterized protein n=1 Tax=Ixodes persulcatus TaxID=34615 RepID=A0AC60P6F4_IXOPE|nr:hypothetical protein HPB47_008121 [Ixodes persulcatus]
MSESKGVVAVKVGVKTSKGDQLTTLDLTCPLRDTVADLCQRGGLAMPEHYALAFAGGKTGYICEENKQTIRKGDLLQLVRSPAMVCKEIIDKLSFASLDEKMVALDVLLGHSSDPVFAVDFISNNGHKLLLSALEGGLYKGRLLCKVLQCLQELMEHNLISWDSLSEKCLNRILKETNSLGALNALTMEVCLSVLESVVNSSPYAYEVVFTGLPWDRYVHFIVEGSISMFKNSVVLLNTLFVKGNRSQQLQIEDAILRLNMKVSIWKSLTKKGNVDVELAQVLYMLQSLLLNTYEEKRRATLDISNPVLTEKLQLLLKFGFCINLEDLDLKQRGSRRFSAEYTALGFRHVAAPLKDFMYPTGKFAFENLCYFAENHSASFTRVVQENVCCSPQHRCPLTQSSIMLSELLCRIFRIGEPVSDQGTFYLMFFSHDRFFEELFSVCMVLVFKTWREMRATTEDIHKVFSIVNEQIVRALSLNPRSINIDAFRATFSSLPYSEIMNQLHRESAERKAFESQSTAVKELRDSLKDDMMELVKSNRINVLAEGARFPKYNAKGQRVKDRYVYVKLSPNRKALHYGDCGASCEYAAIEDLTKKIAVVDIEAVNTGIHCPQAQGRSNRGVIDVAFSVVPCNGETPLNLVAPSVKALHRWVDGLNALLGHDVDSIEARGDLGVLLDMEIKLRLLETEGVQIPDVPPPIPPDPADFDFYFM